MAELRYSHRLAICVCLLALAFLPFGSGETRRPWMLERCTSCVPAEIREKVTVGINLGQSNITVIAYHFNKTATILSNRYGSDEYRALIEDLSNVKPIRRPTLRQRMSFDFMDYLKRTVAPAIGYTTREARIFTELVHTLKADISQDILSHIHRATISGPFLPAHYPTTLARDILVDVLVRGGLTKSPFYLTEARAVQAITGRLPCPPFEVESGDSKDTRNVINPRDKGLFFISISNSSLYTSFSRTSCFYRWHWEWDGIINSRYGLANLLNRQTPESFWAEMESYLMDRAANDLKNYEWMDGDVGLILAGGEGATEAEFQRVLQNVANTINQLHGSQAVAEMVVPPDPMSVVAQGAAMKSRIETDLWYYCDREECPNPNRDLRYELAMEVAEKMEL